MAIKVNQYQESVRTQAAPTPQMPRFNNPASGLVQGIGEFQKAVETRDLEIAELEAEEALQGFIRDSNSILLSGENPYYGSQGKEAVTRAQEVQKQLDQLARDTQGKITHPQAQRQLQRAIQSRLTSEYGRIQTHALNGQKAWDKALAETGIEQAAEQMMLYANDPKRVDASIVAIQHQVRAANPGMPEESIMELAETTVSRSLRSAIENEIERNPGVAQAMMERYTDRIEPGDYQILQGKLKATTDLQRIEAAFNGIRRRHPDDPRAQRKAADGLFGQADVKLRDELKRRLTNEYNYDRAIEQQEQQDLYNHVSMSLYTGSRLSDFKPDVLERLTPAQRNNLMSVEGARSKGGSRVTNPNVQVELMGMSNAQLAAPDFDPSVYYKDLSEKHWDQLLTRWNNARNGSGTKDYTSGLFTHNSIIKEALDSVSDDEDYQREALIFIDETLAQIHQTNGKITAADVRMVADEVILRKRNLTDYSGFDTDDRVSISQIDYDNVPPDFEETYKRKFRARYQRDPDEQEITRFYRQYVWQKSVGLGKVKAHNQSVEDLMQEMTRGE